ncbi:MAG: divalent metal cation transporter [Hymenobacter sp.]
MLYIAIGILGATVMPHNLYLHSAIVQTPQLDRDTAEGKRDRPSSSPPSTRRSALVLAFFINAAILVIGRRRLPRHGLRRTWPTSPTPTALLRRCSARARPAWCLPWRCWLRARTPRSPARWPGRS